MNTMPLGALMLDVEGTSLNDNDRRRLSHPSVGAVILFSRNFVDRAQISALIVDIRALREPQLLIAVDQEGGRVQRFQHGFTRIPSMATFGELYEAEQDKNQVLDLVSHTAHLMAQELIECGVDFSFAPVLDLGVHAQTVIGDRAFHAEPSKLIDLATAFVDGMTAAGMQATGKHFPGHGHVLADSHLETPIDKRALSGVEQKDIKPFAALSNKLGAMMTAHIDFSDIDSQLPTFSKFWLQTILRQQLNFNGLIFSDDLTMHGACIGGNIIERTELALAAGCDMAIICNDHAAMDGVLEAKAFLSSSQSIQRFMSMKARAKNKLSTQTIELTQSKLKDLL